MSVFSSIFSEISNMQAGLVSYPILTHVYVLHYINTLDKDFVVHFERKKKLTKFATFVAWYTMTQGKGQV